MKHLDVLTDGSLPTRPRDEQYDPAHFGPDDFRPGLMTPEDELSGGSLARVTRMRPVRSSHPDGEIESVVVKEPLAGASVDEKRRLRQEVKFLRELNGSDRNPQIPGVVPALAGCMDREEPYFVIPFYPTGSLVQCRNEAGGRMNEHVAVAITAKLLLTIRRIHDQGIIHRDIKPGNILMVDELTPLLADFGVACHRAGQQNSVDEPMTKGFPGTTAYASNAALSEYNQPVPAHDLSMVARVLFELLTGELWSNRKLDPEPLIDVPYYLKDFLQRALADSRSESFPDAGSMLDELTRRRRAGSSLCDGPPIGIDLGTTRSALAAKLPLGDKLDIFGDGGVRNSLMPSAVLVYGPDEELYPAVAIGHGAENIGQFGEDSYFEYTKRIISHTDHTLDGNDLASWNAEDVAALILAGLVNSTDQHHLSRDAVITVPAWFKDLGRWRTRRAALRAGLNVLKIISEPTAAAIAWAVEVLRPLIARENVEETERKLILVYDLGGGTFDVSLLEYQISAERSGRKHSILEIARDGIEELGGLDWDNRVCDFMFENEQFAATYRRMLGEEFTTPPRIRALAQKLKEQLSSRKKSREKDVLSEVTHTLTAVEFDTRTQDLLERTREIVLNLLSAQGITPDDIDYCIPVGGATQMQQVDRLLNELFPDRIDRSLNQDQIVAKGAAYAALHTAAAEGNTDWIKRDEDHSLIEFLKCLDIKEVSSENYGWRVTWIDANDVIRDKLYPVFVERNDPLPVSSQQQTVYPKPGHSGADFVVYSGSRVERNGQYRVLREEDRQEVTMFRAEFANEIPREKVEMLVEFTVSPEGMVGLRYQDPTVVGSPVWKEADRKNLAGLSESIELEELVKVARGLLDSAASQF